MATAKEYFEKTVLMEIGAGWNAIFDGREINLLVKMALDFEGGSKYLKIYIPECEAPDTILEMLATKRSELLDVGSTVLTESGFTGHSERIPSTSLRFSGRMLVNTPTIISDERWRKAQRILEAQGFNVVVRDGTYVRAREEYERPLAFMSHDSRDKDEFVRPLAVKLSSLLCPVWYDEYSLVPGDSLRESIEKGLKICPKCIVVLSKNFFSNPGWSKREFDTVYAREVLEGRRVMIPIWLGVTKQEVYDYSPILLDTLGISADLGIDQVAAKIMVALNSVRSLPRGD